MPYAMKKNVWDKIMLKIGTKKNNIAWKLGFSID